MPETDKVIIVSPNPDIFDFIKENYQGWDCQTLASSFDDLYTGIDDGTLDGDNTKIIIFDDMLIDDDVSELADAIALYAPYALVFLLSYRPNLLDLLTERVQKKMRDNEAEAPFFIAQQESALDDIDEVVDFNKPFLEGQVETPQQLPDVKVIGNPALVTDDEVKGVLAEAQQNNTSSVDGERPLGYVISSTSSKGGSGKTTVALALGTTLAQASRKAYDEKKIQEDPLSVCVVDMDVRDGQIGFYTGQLQPTALNIRVAKEVSQETVRKNVIYDERLGVNLLLAPKRSNTAQDLSASFYRQVIETLKTMFDLIILDTSVQYYDKLSKDVCFPLSDAILFISNLSAGSVYGMTRWAHETTEPSSKGGQGLPIGKVGVVLNGAMDDVGMNKEMLSKAAAGMKIISMIPMDSKAVIAASNFNRMDKLAVNLKLGPHYYKLAQLIARNMNAMRQDGGEFVLEPLITERMTQDVAERQNATVAVSPSSKKKKGLFGRR